MLDTDLLRTLNGLDAHPNNRVLIQRKDHFSEVLVPNIGRFPKEASSSMDGIDSGFIGWICALLNLLTT